MPQRQCPEVVTLIDVRTLSCRYGVVESLCNVTLAVRAGEIRALLGPNGAGKTTLLRALVGLSTPASGVVRVAGQDPAAHDRRALREIGFVPAAGRTFYLRLSGRENLRFFGRLAGLDRATTEQRSLELLEAVDLLEVRDRPVGGYSQGMQRRLAIARALLGRPSVLLIDEATHDLDPRAATHVRALISEAARSGAAVLWTTQRVEEVRGFATSVTVLDHGSVCFDGSVAELLARTPASRYVLEVRVPETCTPAALVAALVGIGSVQPVLESSDARATWVLELAPGVELGAAIARLVAVGVGVRSCRDETSEVERAVLALTMGSAS